MKKILSLLFVMLFIVGCVPAMAEPDDPFESGINYNSEWHEFSAMPSMLKFGYANLAPGEDLFYANSHKGCTTIKDTIQQKALERGLDNRLTYYVYFKWQHGESFTYLYLDELVVLTDTNGNYYSKRDSCEMNDIKRRTTIMNFWPVNDLLERVREDNGGTIPKGNYSFSLFINDQVFKTVKFRVT